MSKKGQSLSVNTIIVAVLALIVLVVLVVIFVNQFGLFEKGVNEQSNTKLVELKIRYGECHPSGSAEKTFRETYSSDVEGAQDDAIDDLNELIDLCNDGSEPVGCNQKPGCSWG